MERGIRGHMAKNITIPDINTANFNQEFSQFVVRLSKDQNGSTVVEGILCYKVRDSLGNVQYMATYSAPMSAGVATTLKNFLIANYIPGLKVQEGL